MPATLGTLSELHQIFKEHVDAINQLYNDNRVHYLVVFGNPSTDVCGLVTVGSEQDYSHLTDALHTLIQGKFARLVVRTPACPEHIRKRSEIGMSLKKSAAPAVIVTTPAKSPVTYSSAARLPEAVQQPHSAESPTASPLTKETQPSQEAQLLEQLRAELDARAKALDAREADLNDREEYLNQAEESLMTNLNRIDTRNTELDHREEELNKLALKLGAL